jgi:hypothetical protein
MHCESRKLDGKQEIIEEFFAVFSRKTLDQIGAR